MSALHPHPTDVPQSDPSRGATDTMPDTVDSTTDTARAETFRGVVDVLTRTLGIEDRAGSITADTRLFGDLPELDSLGVVELAAALEDRFDIVIDDEDFTGEVFESVGTLADFVDGRRGTASA